MFDLVSLKNLAIAKFFNLYRCVPIDKKQVY
jgi:hypothetical protein